MKRTAKKIIVAATVTAITLSGVPVVQACGGGGGRSRVSRPAVGFGLGVSLSRPTVSRIRPTVYPTARQTHYTTPSYQQPSYQQPSYQQPVYQQPSYQQTTYPQQTYAAAAPVVQSSPVISNPIITSRPAIRPNVAPIKTPALPKQSVLTSKATAIAPMMAAKSVPAQSSTATTDDAESSALAMLATIVSDAGVEDTNGSQPAKQLASKQIDASIPQFAPVAASSTNPNHVGAWTATLPSKVMIELQLSENGTFRWSVKNNGTATDFSGQYRITDGRLTLVRSNDLQQMAGSWVRDDNGFTFKLDGADNSGLNFKKV